MVRKQVKYERIDENRIRRIEVYESEIRLDELRQEIRRLREQLKDIPTPKTTPDQETLDFWNEVMCSDRQILEAEIKEKEKFLKQLEGL